MANQIKFGLKVTPEDRRDLRVGSIFSLAHPDDLPDQLTPMYPLKIKDQGATDYCTGFATTEVSEDEEGVELDPLYQFHKTKELDGDPNGFGADLRTACKSLVKFGSLEQRDAPYSINDPRSEIVAGAKWTPEYDQLAQKHRKGAFLAVLGPYDLFDNFRSTLAHKRFLNQSIVTGIDWCEEWLTAAGGVLKAMGTPMVGHCFKIFDYKKIAGEFYLVAQLSQNQSVGDQGLFYLSRAVVNQGCQKYGGFVFTDLPVETLQYYQDNKIQADRLWLIQLIQLALNLLKEKLNHLFH